MVMHGGTCAKTDRRVWCVSERERGGGSERIHVDVIAFKAFTCMNICTLLLLDTHSNTSKHCLCWELNYYLNCFSLWNAEKYAWSILKCCRGLPSKSPEETEKHKQEYEAMVEAAKKKGNVNTKRNSLKNLNYFMFMHCWHLALSKHCYFLLKITFIP